MEPKSKVVRLRSIIERTVPNLPFDEQFVQIYRHIRLVVDNQELPSTDSIHILLMNVITHVEGTEKYNTSLTYEEFEKSESAEKRNPSALKYISKVMGTDKADTLSVLKCCLPTVAYSVVSDLSVLLQAANDQFPTAHSIARLIKNSVSEYKNPKQVWNPTISFGPDQITVEMKKTEQVKLFSFDWVLSVRFTRTPCALSTITLRVANINLTEDLELSKKKTILGILRPFMSRQEYIKLAQLNPQEIEVIKYPTGDTYEGTTNDAKLRHGHGWYTCHEGMTSSSTNSFNAYAQKFILSKGPSTPAVM